MQGYLGIYEKVFRAHRFPLPSILTISCQVELFDVLSLPCIPAKGLQPSTRIQAPPTGPTMGDKLGYPGAVVNMIQWM